MNRFRKKFRALFHRRRLETDLDDELRFHLEMAGEESNPASARLRFGNTASIREICRDQWSFHRLETWWQDIRYSLRTFARNPAFAAVAVAALALGIGADTAIFTIVKGAMTWNMGMDQPNRVMILNPTDATHSQDFGASYPDFRDLRGRVKSFHDLAVYTFVPVNLSDGNGPPERLNCVRASSGSSRIAPQKPILGRDFTAADELPGAPAVVILGHHVWKQRYGGDPNIIGRKVRINEIPTEIIGVMEPGKRFPEDTDIWVPLIPTPTVDRREARNLLMFGRLADGVSVAAARAELDAIMRSLAAQDPGGNRGLAVNLHLMAELTGAYGMRPFFELLFASVGFVLLIACADVANMLLARAAGRAREISIRIAIGAGRARIIRQLLIESTMLSVAGGVLGWLVALVGLRWFDAGVGTMKKPVWLDLHLDLTAYLYLLAISAGTGVLFGLAPALRLAKIDIQSSLKDGGYGMVSGRRSLRLARGLVAFEMALCVILLASASLMIRSAGKLYGTPIGMNTTNVLSMHINLPEAKYHTRDDEIAFHVRLDERLRALPGVEALGVTSNLPLGNWLQFPYQLEGTPLPQRLPRLSAILASAGYFQAGQVKPRRGRLYTDADYLEGQPSVVVNESFAAKMWPGADAIGKRLRLLVGHDGGQWLTVVGVVPDILQNFHHLLDREPLLYLPFGLSPMRQVFVLARTAVPPSTLTSVFRAEVGRLDENLPIYDVRTLDDWISEQRLTVGLFSGICTVFAAIALVLASIGLYSVTAHSVSQRMQEFGIRMAMGGETRDILGLILRHSLSPLIVGLLIGMPMAMMVGKLLRSMLSGTAPTDYLAYAAAGAVLLLAGVAGCVVPARRAMRVDPVVILRYE